MKEEIVEELYSACVDVNTAVQKLREIQEANQGMDFENMFPEAEFIKSEDMRGKVNEIVKALALLHSGYTMSQSVANVVQGMSSLMANLQKAEG